MDDTDALAMRFETHRGRLRALAYRMLGSIGEADDAVQEAWLRLSTTDADDVRNLGGWLTTVTARVCLNLLRSRTSHPEQPFGVHVPDPVVSQRDGSGPEQEAMLADSVGLAMLVVLDSLTPGERVAFVLHDLFDVPFGEIAPIIGATPAAARQLASRARRRVQHDAPTPDADISRQRAVVDAFFAASRHGDFSALVALLDPNVVLRADGGPSRPAAAGLLEGAHVVATQALSYGRFAPFVHSALVNATAGAVIAPRGRAVSVMSFLVRDGKIVAIDVLADPERLSGLDLGVWPGSE